MKSNFLSFLSILFTIGILFLPDDAYMSQVHYSDISLKRLVENSKFILIVNKSIPFTTVKEIDCNDLGKHCPPFSQIIYHFKVIEELLNRGGEPMVGKEIEVLWAYSHEQLYLHKMYYLDGISKSPIYDLYKTKADFNRAKQLIIFIRTVKEKDYEFSAVNSYESITQKQNIIDIIKLVRSEE